ncbi:YjbH domain-containing protein [Dyadobacter frigoris]|uniref:YjbH domain-containing protein n=1 Tax=Dyadobacter frigoris TaxID=2576211 RepID=UPI00286E5995|nr:YjbH domain-containing protein [Dyadobacter frigoris]
MNRNLTKSIYRLVDYIHIFNTKKGNRLLPFLVFFCVSTCSYSQMNISGKPGLIFVPTAVETKNGSFIFGYVHNPINYSFRQNGKNSESTYFINLTIFNRLDVNLNLMRMNGKIPDSQRGIGDRQLDLKYLILKEKKYIPSLAVFVSAPFGIDNSFTSNAMVATKTFNLINNISAQVTGGYGSPYYFKRDESEKTNYNIFEGLSLENKKDLKYRYLSGPIGGVNLRYAKKGGIMFEWDSQHFNIGAYGVLFKKWTIQAGVMNFDQITFGTSYALNLKSLPKRLKQANEN